MQVGLDFETYGSVDLPKYGLDRYIRDKWFTPLIGSLYYVVPNVSNASASNIGFRGGKVPPTHREIRARFDFVHRMDESQARLKQEMQSATLISHNAGFEVAVLDWLGIKMDPSRVIDSAVCSRAAGGESHLAAAAPQLLNVRKMDEGRDLIKLFSIPGKYQEENGTGEFDPRVITDNPAKWELFQKYCDLDAELGYRLAKDYPLLTHEQEYYEVTLKMNQLGWHVDVDMVEEMHRRYLENLEAEKEWFAQAYDKDLNLNSYPQLKEWCEARGVKAKSFDEKHVTRYLEQLDKKLTDDSFLTSASLDKIQGYTAVRDLMRTKKVLGGSSLKKLKVILDTVGPDARLRDQYVHIGAGQSYRTTGRSVQMQNLKRLGGRKLEDMDVLMREADDFDNDTLAENMRQVFTATDPKGFLIVGDFKSVESRMLAWLAHEKWKLDAYRSGRDVYVELGDKFNESRTFGKVGELSCGYNAGPEAVQSFAEGMGVKLSEAEASRLVYSWRDACPRTVEFWHQLDDMLQDIMSGRKLSAQWELSDKFTLILSTVTTPESLVQQHSADVTSISMRVYDSEDNLYLERRFLGCFMRGRDIVYYKPSNKKSGDLWSNHFTDPKTKRIKFHTIYGGKLTGILTQSMCRELFFQALLRVDRWSARFDNINLVGQFHDEIVLDWAPGGLGLNQTVESLEAFMSHPGLAVTFPLAADIKWDYRYTK